MSAPPCRRSGPGRVMPGSALSRRGATLASRRALASRRVALISGQAAITELVIWHVLGRRGCRLDGVPPLG